MRYDSKITLSASLGICFEFYSFLILIFLSPIITEVFFGIYDLKSIFTLYLIFSVGYFVRPFGGCLLGLFGNKFGKKAAYFLASLVMALSTIFMGALPTYVSIGSNSVLLLLICRIFQGLAFGGEIPTALSYVFDLLHEDRKFLSSTMLSIGLEMGTLLATVVAYICVRFLSVEQIVVWGWRTPFFLGAIFSAVGLYFRYKLTDIPELSEKDDHKKLREPVKKVFKSHGRSIVLSFLLNFCVTILFSIFCIFLPLILHYVYSYDLSIILGYNIYFMIMLIVMTYLVAKLTKVLGVAPRIVFIFIVIMIGIFVYPMFMIFQTHFAYLIMTSYLLISLLLGAIISILPYITCKLFDKKTMYTGLSVSYNMAQCIGGGLITILIIFVINPEVNFTAPNLIIFCSSLALLSVVLLIFDKGRRRT